MNSFEDSPQFTHSLLSLQQIPFGASIDFSLQKPEANPLVVTTVVERTNVATNQRAYQSSDVDGHTADFAAAEPAGKVSKTRREVDPWWEVDLGRSQNLLSVSASISTGIKQSIHVSILLLPSPLGFEDPFLDR